MIITSVIPDEKNEKKSFKYDENSVTPASGDAYSVLNLDLFEEKRAQNRESYQDIADGTELSEPTIRRFFHGQAKNPSFWNVYAISSHLGLEWHRVIRGGSDTQQPASMEHMKEIIKMKDSQIEDISAQRDRYRDHFKREIDEVRRLADERLKEKQINMESQAQTIKNLYKTINSQTVFIRIGVIILVVLLLADIVLGGSGWIRYEGGLSELLF